MPIDPKKIELQRYSDRVPSILRKATVYTQLHFYRKSDVLVQLTKAFCERFLPKYGDRTVDQMVQAARSIKQNIAEGLTDGQMKKWRIAPSAFAHGGQSDDKFHCQT